MIEAKLRLDTSGFKKGISDASSALGSFVTGAVSIAVFQQAFSRITEGFQRGKDAFDLSEQVGASVGTLKMFQMEMTRNGMEADTLAEVLGKLQKRIGEAAMQGGEAAIPFQRLGLDFQALAQMDGGMQFTKTLDALSKITDKTQKAAIASKLFEEAGLKIQRMANNGSLSRLNSEPSLDAKLLQASAPSLNRAAIGEKTTWGKIQDFYTGLSVGVARGKEMDAGKNTSPLSTGAILGLAVREAFGGGINVSGLDAALKKKDERPSGSQPPAFTFPGISSPIFAGETIASSLQRIGGGGGFAQGGNAMLTIARTIESAVKQIQQNTSVIGELTGGSNQSRGLA